MKLKLLLVVARFNVQEYKRFGRLIREANIKPE